MIRFTDRMRAAALIGGYLATLAWAAPCLADEGKCECPTNKTVAGVPLLAYGLMTHRPAVTAIGAAVLCLGVCAGGAYLTWMWRRAMAR